MPDLNQTPNESTDPIPYMKLAGLNGNVVSFRLLNRTYSVHEDLICLTSKLYKGDLQSKRKPIEGDCAICHNEINPEIEDIVFCRGSCGQNLHRNCIDGWFASNPIAHKTCPFCRSLWFPEPTGIRPMRSFDHIGLEQWMIHIYIGWLYTRCFQYDNELVKNEDDAFFIYMIKLHGVAAAFEDKEFGKTVLRAMYRDSDDHPGVKAVSYAWQTRAASIVKTLLVEMSIGRYREQDDALAVDGQAYPKEFLLRVIRHLMGLVKEQDPEFMKIFED